MKIGQESSRLDDNILAARAAQGDEEAFAVLTRRYLRFIYSVAYQVLCHEEDALDTTQEVLIRLSRRMDRYRGPGSFRAWVAKITTKAAIDFLRSGRRREEATDESVLIDLTDASLLIHSPNPREVLEEKQRLEQIDAAMRQLSRQQRAILVLRLREDLSAQETAEALGIPVEQVRVQLHRALQKVREELKAVTRDE